MDEFRTQTDELYDYLKVHGSITPTKALFELGIYRLSARVSDLRRRGVPIITERESIKARNGRMVSFARYELKEVS